uniref:Uncharacterized protein n=1 Tax=Anolis carolinensis TaxID=28377 RepID=A0A803TL89_ANOCA
ADEYIYTRIYAYCAYLVDGSCIFQLYVYVFVCMYVYIYIYTHLYTCVCVYIYIHTHIHIYIYTLCLCTYTPLYVCLCAYMYILHAPGSLHRSSASFPEERPSLPKVVGCSPVTLSFLAGAG